MLVENYSVLSENELEFDIYGIDPAILNSLRRVILSEVSTLAIEKVLIKNNTSVIPDEVLAHRLGLIPILANPKLLSFYSEGAEIDENNHLKFSLVISDVKEKVQGTVHIT